MVSLSYGRCLMTLTSQKRTSRMNLRLEAEEDGAQAEDDTGYDTAEEEDYLDGERMLAHLTSNKLTEDKLSAVTQWVDYVGRSKEDMEPLGDE